MINWKSALVLTAAMLIPTTVVAQEREVTKLFKLSLSAAAKASIDPTTYAPAFVAYDGTMRDWNTSQIFFRNGFLEQNPRFTVSGYPNDVAVSYEVGRSRILQDSLAILAVSGIHNFSEYLVEDALKDVKPEHKKLLTVLGWVERSAVAVAMSTMLAGPHYRQAGLNVDLASQLGLR